MKQPDFSERHQWLTHTEEENVCDQVTCLKYVFVYSSLNVGGVETLIVRLSNWLVSKGHDVLLVLIKPGKLDYLLDPCVKVIFLGSHIRASLPGGAATKINKAAFLNADVLCAFDPQSLWMAMLCAPLCAEKTRFFVGVYHPRIYFFSQQTDLRAVLHLKLLRSCVIPDSIAFMNEACRVSHEKNLGMDFSKSNILPLPLVDRGVLIGAPERFKIVSVGRLTAFKTYNLYMIDVIGALVKSGFQSVSWHVYGDGPLMPEMVCRIEECALQGHIFLHGEVPYEKLHNVMAHAYVFVGMGTALIEAGSYGVPSIPAIESEGAVTYGYIYDLEGFNVGERSGRQPVVSVQLLLERLLAMSDVEYKLESEKTRRHCERFLMNSVGNEFVAQRRNLGGVASLRSISTSYVLAYFVVVLCDSLISLSQNLFIGIVKICFPEGCFSRLRVWNRKRLALKNRREMAPGVGLGLGKDKVED